METRMFLCIRSIEVWNAKLTSNTVTVLSTGLIHACVSLHCMSYGSKNDLLSLYVMPCNS